MIFAQHLVAGTPPRHYPANPQVQEIHFLIASGNRCWVNRAGSAASMCPDLNVTSGGHILKSTQFHLLSADQGNAHQFPASPRLRRYARPP